MDMTHTESPPTVKYCTKHFSICTLLWAIRLQLNARHAYGLRSTVPHQTNMITNMEQTFQQWLVPPYLAGALPKPYHICESNMQYMLTITVFFKHKYITQPTVMLADQIVKEYQDLTWAIQGLVNSVEMHTWKHSPDWKTVLNCCLNALLKCLLCNIQGWSPGRFLHQFQGCWQVNRPR